MTISISVDRGSGCISWSVMNSSASVSGARCSAVGAGMLEGMEGEQNVVASGVTECGFVW